MTSPSKPILALSVGIVGHRPNRLPQGTSSVAARIDEVLMLLKRTAEETRRRHPEFADAPASLILVSALAEGADRIAAHSALRSGFAVDVVLPFAVDDYEKDFIDPDSRVDYRRLIDEARQVVVLPGDYDAEHRDYDPAGRFVLDAADIILGVWDGGPSGGRGGTTDLLERAASTGIPIIHVDATGRAPTRLLWAGLAGHEPGAADLAVIPSAPLAEVVVPLVEAIAQAAIGDAAEAGRDRS